MTSSANGATDIIKSDGEKGIDGFLDIVYETQFSANSMIDMCWQFFEPFTERLKEVLSEETYRDIEDIFTDCAVENNRYYAVEAMKMAIGIKDGTFIPVV